MTPPGVRSRMNESRRNGWRESLFAGCEIKKVSPRSAAPKESDDYVGTSTPWGVFAGVSRLMLKAAVRNMKRNADIERRRRAPRIASRTSDRIAPVMRTTVIAGRWTKAMYESWFEIAAEARRRRPRSFDSATRKAAPFGKNHAIADVIWRSRADALECRQHPHQRSERSSEDA